MHRACGHGSGTTKLTNITLRKRNVLDCIMWQSCTLFLDLFAPSVRTESMYLLQAITRPCQVCWKSEQRDGRGLSFGKFSIF